MTPAIEDTLLSQLLQRNHHLTHLDLSGNTRMPDRLLQWALTGHCAFLQTLNLSGCELLKPGYVGGCCPGLRDLNLAGTAAGDAEVALLAAGLPDLTRLVLNGCRKVSDAGVSALAAAPALQRGHHLNP
ncbi:hypothetical protein OEZ85_005695 [Tetradesmus obliquus]|uniref:Distal membrane arm assembly complex 2-like protein n=1 Tax=Tetradesmus obliquus TaxID=3088 RepID=A0ABY8UE56_TETOB|nr:hypothetical protein OEZ85_005695 [Tetradesmus obliquus]